MVSRTGEGPGRATQAGLLALDGPAHKQGDQFLWVGSCPQGLCTATCLVSSLFKLQSE